MTKDEALTYLTKTVVPSLLAHPEIDSIRVSCTVEVYGALFDPGAESVVLIDTPDQREVFVYVELEEEKSMVQRTRETIHPRSRNETSELDMELVPVKVESGG